MGSDESGWWSIRPPVDLLVVSLLSVATTVAALLPALSAWDGRYALAIVAVFLPGYALVAALFPHGPRSPEDRSERVPDVRRIDAFERAVLSATLGLVTTPLLGIAVEFSRWSFRPGPVLTAVTAFVLVASVVATVRRHRLPAEERYTPARRWVDAFRTLPHGRPSVAANVVTVVVIVAVVVAAGGVFAVATTPHSGERFTEFALLNATEERGVVAGSYPRTVTAGSETSVVLEIANREGRSQSYTVVPRLQRVATVDDRPQVIENQSFEPIRLTVDASEIERETGTVSPTMTGENLRLVFLLYRGDPPDETTTDTAYRWTHVWLNVTEPPE